MHSGDNIGGVEERLGVSRQQHEEAHQRHRRPMNQSGDGGPHEEVTHKALNSSGQVDHPRSGQLGPPKTTASMRDGGVEEAGENADVRADIFEDGNGIER